MSIRWPLSFRPITVRSSVAALLIGAPLGAQVSAPVPAAQAPIRVRTGRLLGVFDGTTGAPLDDVTVTNTLTGLSAKTSATGTLSLFFVDTSGAILRVQKMGYQPQTMVVGNSDRDTIPLTIVLESAGQRLATVVTTAKAKRNPTDTVRSLELNGFYERRETTGAPSSAFQTGDRVERLTLLSDITALSGRAICASNLYLNGVRVPAPDTRVGRGRVSRSMRSNPVDQLVNPQEVLAVEMYHDGEVPASYNMTRAPGVPSCGATLIWTK